MSPHPRAPLILLAAALTGCAGTLSTKTVQVLDAPPSVPYVEIEKIRYHQIYKGDMRDNIVDGLQRQAAALNADAVIITERHVSRTMEHLSGYSDSPEEFISGTAIRYGTAPAPTSPP